MYDMKNMTKLKRLGELAPDAFKKFVAFDEAACQDGAIPAHETVNAAHAPENLRPGAKQQVIGIREQDLRPRFL